MKKVYVVYGSTGVYEDRYEWNVFAFTDKEEAQSYTDKLNELAKVVEASSECMYDLSWKSPECLTLLRYDPNASRMDYNGTRYHIAEVEIKKRKGKTQ